MQLRMVIWLKWVVSHIFYRSGSFSCILSVYILWRQVCKKKKTKMLQERKRWKNHKVKINTSFKMESSDPEAIHKIVYKKVHKKSKGMDGIFSCKNTPILPDTFPKKISSSLHCPIEYNIVSCSTTFFQTVESSVCLVWWLVFDSRFMFAFKECYLYDASLTKLCLFFSYTFHFRPIFYLSSRQRSLFWKTAFYSFLGIEKNNTSMPCLFRICFHFFLCPKNSHIRSGGSRMKWK